jgi:rRNA maturation endonuclease Nob1
MRDAAQLLKAQEPILLENQHKPYGINTNANSPWISRCPKCGKKIEGKQTRFCKYCGQAVKWND